MLRKRKRNVRTIRELFKEGVLRRSRGIRKVKIKEERTKKNCVFRVTLKE